MNKEVLLALREVLALAEAGEVTSVAIATVSPGLATGSAFRLGDGTLAEILGSIRLMEHRILVDSAKGELK